MIKGSAVDALDFNAPVCEVAAHSEYSVNGFTEVELARRVASEVRIQWFDVLVMVHTAPAASSML